MTWAAGSSSCSTCNRLGVGTRAASSPVPRLKTSNGTAKICGTGRGRECPLWVKSKHLCTISAIGQKRTSSTLLDHLFGASDQPRRDCQTKCFGGLQIDSELKFCRQLNREVLWLLAL